MKNKWCLLLGMLMMCWAAQSLAQPTRANQQANQKNKDLYGAMGECIILQKNTPPLDFSPDTAYNVFYLKDTDAPGWDDGEQVARVLKNSIEKGTPNYYAIDPYGDVRSVTVLQQPKHGNLSKAESNFSYTPHKNYVGNDKVTMLVDMAGYKIKVVYYIKVVTEKASDRYDRHKNETYRTKYDIYSEKYCPSGEQWLISQSGINGVRHHKLTSSVAALALPAAWLTRN